MAAPKEMKLEGIRRFLKSLFGEDVHAMRVLSLANATLGVLSSASLAVHAIGQGLAHARGLIVTLSALTRRNVGTGARARTDPPCVLDVARSSPGLAHARGLISKQVDRLLSNAGIDV